MMSLQHLRDKYSYFTYVKSDGVTIEGKYPGRANRAELIIKFGDLGSISVIIILSGVIACDLS